MLTTAAAILAALVSLVLVVGLLVAMAFFIGVIGYGWVSVLATKEELQALPPGRRKWVLARAILAVSVLWLMLLGSNNTNPSGRFMDGHDTFAFFYKLMRRFCGLPPDPPASLLADDA